MRDVVPYLVTLAAGVIVGWFLHVQPEPTASVQLDTVTVAVPSEPVAVTAKPDTVIYHDTVEYRTHAFTALLDTVVMHDTVRLSYQFPEHIFSLDYRPAPDTVRTIYLTRTITTERPWWIDVLTHTGAATLGYAVGSVR